MNARTEQKKRQKIGHISSVFFFFWHLLLKTHAKQQPKQLKKWHKSYHKRALFAFPLFLSYLELLWLKNADFKLQTSAGVVEK